MIDNKIAPKNSDANLKNYSSTYSSFSWNHINSEFNWSVTRKLNISYEAIDRHAECPEKADKNCLIYSHEGRHLNISFREMSTLSNRLANVLKNMGIKKGDRVFLFLPRTPELYISMVGCAKIGAIIVPLYSDYMEGAVRDRMLDGSGKVLITSSRHRSRVLDNELPDLKNIIVIGEPDYTLKEKDVLWNQVMDKASDDFEIEWVDKDFPLFLIYTSGYDGNPIGLIHTHDSMRGYLATSRWVLDLKDNDVLWTNARPGWLMNVVYSAFAPWLCGVTTFVSGKMETAEQIYRHIEENNISVMYTIPTVYKIIMKAGKKTADSFQIQSLRHLVSALEPLNSDLIYSVMNTLDLPIYDTWWTAETGMITIANFRSMSIKPGYLGKPVPGIHIKILDPDGSEVAPFTMGEVALKDSWPCMAKGIWKKDKEYKRYLRKKPWFLSGDTAFIDHDNYFVYQGRADTAIITSAGRVGIAEIESTLKLHPAVADAGVVKIPDPDNEKRIKAFITLNLNCEPTEDLKKEIMTYVSNQLSPDIVPREIKFQKKLPKDSNGNISHRNLKAGELGIPFKDI